ncbi:DUF6285 domain-containing protein [Actinophytocola sp.]|uniref:DUF6285 domain-containing protein n=1 Tax=Actinophytocola sp. TaxID=1872138 RepID=UPI002D7E5673|nr:DUF6285 domain-containing protein [Actinophytocola sp.]HET9139128.1 DUF6285 domain-containing protein [Actinophytocola sp.]HEU5110694.1 DUF6285 domain-containing protein [Micromonosporaceae bacterium]
MLHERPTAAELVAAVADFLEREVRPALDGRLAFHAKVATNALRIVQRELTAGPAVAEAELTRLRSLTNTDADLPTLNTLLAAQIRAGTLSIADSALRDHLIRSVLSRITIDNPGYPSVAEAATRWPDR